MIPIPELDRIDTVFGNIEHMPKYETLPDDFKSMNDKTPYNKFVSQWFFGGLKSEDLERLTPKEGVDKAKALSAVKAILASFEPKHEHKIGGSAYLLSQWFDLKAA